MEYSITGIMRDFSRGNFLSVWCKSSSLKRFMTEIGFLFLSDGAVTRAPVATDCFTIVSISRTCSNSKNLFVKSGRSVARVL